jgi:acyl transferase domain-containing protein/acyl carrier protein
VSQGPTPRLEDRLASLSPAKRALLEKRLQGRQESQPSAPVADPIAIVGMGCRFPGGADSPEAFWSLLAAGVDAISEVPRTRWDVERIFDADTSRAGRTNSRHGGFLDGIDMFDPGFFGISPREASRMDPQQRLFLEVAWEAIDDAGIDVERLAGTDTGVFAGLHSHASDYFWFDLPSPERMDAFTGPGTSHNIVTGRLSYLFDFQGPSLIVDTACSSSLVAIHLACRSLREKECSVALAGGVNLILSPQFTIALSRLQVLSPDGRCRAFDSRANGFVRSEGCGVIVLKRLADARAAGDRILALVRGSAVNQDGRTNGITAPNSQSQQRVMERALADAGVTGPQIGYVETHGTGTALGDPIEIEALSAVMGRPRPGGERCVLGAGKSNIGHAEGAAGVAGVIKAVLTLQHRAMAPVVHFQRLNPHISLEGTSFEIPTTVRPWEGNGGPRLAGVSSFGWSGTNAHVVLEEAAEVEKAVPEASGPWVLPVSARSEGALRELASRYKDLLTSGADAPSLQDICYSAGVRRTHHDYRIAVEGDTREQLAGGLAAYIGKQTTWRTAQGRAVSGRRASVVFVFSGQGPQWWGMGRELLAASPVFRERIEQCAAALPLKAGWSLMEALTATESESRLGDTEVAQPAIFALQLALAAVWESLGVVPAAVVGHSVGEIAAAVVAGALSLEEGMRVAYSRGRFMQEATGGGRMTAVEIGQDEAARVLKPFAGRVSIAAVNAAGSCVLSGDAAAIDAIVSALQARGVLCRPLPVNYAFHSAQMEGAARKLADALGRVTSVAPRIPLLSTVSGEPVTSVSLDGAYWASNVRRTVLFAPAIDALAARGHRLFLELGPHPVLGSSIAASGAEGSRRVALPSLHRGRPEQESLLATIGALYVEGYPIDWRRINPAGRVISLPRYPWQRERYWLPDASPATAAAQPVGAHDSAGPVLPGRRIRSPQLRGVIFECALSPSSPAWMADHVIGGRVVVPAAAFVALATAAALAALPGSAALEDVFIHRPLVLDAGARLVQTILTPDADGFALEIQSLPQEGGDEWTLHVTGRVLAADRGASAGDRPEAIAARCTVNVPVEEHYARLERQGADLRTLFQTATQIQRGHWEALARVVLPGALTGEADHYPVHPAVIDGCLQPIIAALPDADPRRDAQYLPQTLGRVQVLRHAAGPVFSHAVLRPASNPQDTRIVADIRVTDGAGVPIALLEGVAFARVADAQSAASALPARLADCVYCVEWIETPAGEREALAPRGTWIVFVDSQGLGDAVIRELEAAEQTCIRVPAAWSANATDGIDPDPASTIARHVAGETRVEGIVHLWSLDVAANPGASAEQIANAQQHACGSVLSLLQAVARQDAAIAPTIHVVTRGAQATGSEGAPGFVQASVLGLARVAALEHPDVRCVCIDIDPGETNPAESLVTELLARDAEREIALRHGRRLARRIVRRANPGRADAPLAGHPPVALDIPSRGVIDNLSLVPIERRGPGPREIEIEVRASGLNFRDVLNVLGVYPGDAGRPGSECAGRVIAVGSAVTEFGVGDDVMALADGAMATHVVTPAGRAVRKPARLTFDEAASLPIAFLTAEYALNDLAHLSRGERVLIHAAAGGVGLAAVQIARRAGAEVYATAGSPEKHAFLHALGVEHVFSSRSLDFAAELMERTEGRGVDVALNSLAGDFIPRTLSVLARSGRFIEIGKTDIWGAAEMQAARPDVEYHALYLGEVFESDPARTQAMLGDLADALTTGALRPLPVRSFPLDGAADAFRFMAQARHIGKIVLEQRPAGSVPRTPSVEPDATYLITGGLGSLGLHVARWLIDSGARNLLLAGRHSPDGRAREEIASLERRGARIDVVASDVASRTQVDALLAHVETSMPPLRGIVHAAGVLDDGVLLEQDWRRFAAVMAPKVLGAWNLHEATLGHPLDMFVLFSSAASALGSPGQAGYASANAFMDALATHRHACGLAALSINWGAWNQGGMAAGMPERASARWAEHGLVPMPPADALALFAEALRRDDGQLMLAQMDWGRYLRQFGRTPALLEDLVPRQHATASLSAAAHAPRLVEMIAGLPAVRRMAALVDHVHAQALRVLGLPATYPLDPEQGLRDAGLDSLMAVELRNQLQADAGTHLPTTLAFDYPTVKAIAGHLAEAMKVAIDDGQVSTAAESAEDEGSARLDEMTDAEAEALLRAELAGLGSVQGLGPGSGAGSGDE